MGLASKSNVKLTNEIQAGSKAGNESRSSHSHKVKIYRSWWSSHRPVLLCYTDTVISMIRLAFDLHYDENCGEY